MVRLFALAAAISIAAAARPVTWADLTPAARARLERAGVTEAAFQTRLDAIDRDAHARIRDGDFDHLVFYLLQSTHFTRLPAIEPALSARALRGGTAIPSDVSARMTAFIRAVDSGDRDPRIAYFRVLLGAQNAGERRATIEAQYRRAMAFLAEKEFGGGDAVDRTARLYESRGLSTDTAVEAGYAVHTGLAVLKALDPARRIRRVLIVGPGLDLAPRTGMLEVGPPESYQPWAVIDALVSLGLSRLGDLEVVGADINPRVVDRLRASRERPPRLQLVTGIGESDTVTFVPGFRDYFEALGAAVGKPGAGVKPPPGHKSKSVAVTPQAAAALRADPLNIVTERLEGESFDLVVATNILPYFGDTQLLLAISNIAGMLARGGVLLHNDTRPEVQEAASLAGLEPEQARQLMIANVKGAPPLADTIVLHRKR